jgi:hypothetical protein
LSGGLGLCELCELRWLNELSIKKGEEFPTSVLKCVMVWQNQELMFRNGTGHDQTDISLAVFVDVPCDNDMDRINFVNRDIA